MLWAPIHTESSRVTLPAAAPALSWGDPPHSSPSRIAMGRVEQQGEQRPHRRDGVETKQLQKQFFIVDDPSKKQGRDQQPPPTAPSVLPRRAHSSHSFPTHVDNLPLAGLTLGRAPCPSPAPLSPGRRGLAHDFPLYSIRTRCQIPGTSPSPHALHISPIKNGGNPAQRCPFFSFFSHPAVFCTISSPSSLFFCLFYLNQKNLMEDLHFFPPF